MKYLLQYNLLLLIPLIVCGADPAPAPVQIADIVRQAVETNPERQIYISALNAERQSVAANVVNSEPVVSIEVGQRRLHEASGAFIDEGLVWTASLTQTFQWPERIRLRRVIADRQIELAQLGLKRFEQAIESKVTVLAYRLSRAQILARASEEVTLRLQGLRKALVGRDTAGPSPAVELRSIEAAEIVARSHFEESRLSMQQILLELNQFRGAPSFAPLTVKVPALVLKDAPKLDTLLAQAKQGNFSYRMQVLDSEQVSLQSDLARSNSVPGITAGPFISNDGVGGRETIVGLQFQIPIPTTGYTESADRASIERRRQTKATIAAAWREVERDIGQAWLSYASKIDQLRMHQDDPTVRFSDAAKIAETHYRAGALPMQLFIEAQSGYLEAVEATLLIQEQAVEAGFRLRELSGVPYNPFSN